MAIKFDDKTMKERLDALSALSSPDSELNKSIRAAISDALKEVRNKISEGIKFENGDPRGTAHSVKRYIARKYFGGVVSVAGYNAKATGVKNTYEAPRKLRPGQRGGNRMPRSAKTQRYLDYGPQDRMFILNFVDHGTKMRKSNLRKLGQITHRGFFKKLGEPAMQSAVESLGKMIEKEFNNIFK